MSLNRFKKYFCFLIFSLTINNLLSNPVVGMEQEENIERNDPAFFRITAQNGREIYIIGGPHHVPIERLVNSAALAEIQRLAELHAIFYSEHESNNEISLRLLEEEENLIPIDVFEQGTNLLSMLNITLSDEEARILAQDSLMLSLGSQSNMTLRKVMQARLWLGAVTLGTHAGILSYNKFGGTEHSLMYGNFQETWSEINYLETPEQAIEILKEFKDGTADTEENKNWVKRSIEKIILLRTKPQEFVGKVVKDQQDKSIKNHSWQVIYYGTSYNLPRSVIERNKLWSRVIKQRLESDQALTPLFIVVGGGHLAGYNEKISFLSFLIQQIKGKRVERFNLAGEWKML